MKNSERSIAMKSAHQIKNKINPVTGEKYGFGIAQRIAWNGIRLKRQMKENVLLITYTKKDGTETQRTATLIPSFLPVRKETTSAPRKRTSEKVNYFELNEDGSGCFKSFLPQNFVCFEILKQAITATLNSDLAIAA